MSRNLYISVFMLLAGIFVPVLLDFGVIAFVVPVGWLAVSVINALLHLEWREAVGLLAYLAVYLLLFYAAACFTYWLSNRAASRTLRATIQAACFAALIACSFFRVLTYSSIKGGGGAYSFWGAVQRAIEKKAVR